MDVMTTIVRFLQEGGAFMYPIILILALGLAIAVERYLYLTSVKNRNMKVWQALIPQLKAGAYDKAANIVVKSKTAMASIVSYGLARLQTSQHRDDIETAMEEGLMEAIPKIEKRTHYLATLANIATLMGLLGTIIGLIQAFTAVAQADPAQKADLLSSSISIAMNTTAFGLIVAIPLLLMHALLQTKTTDIIDNLEMASVKVLNVISTNTRRNAANKRPQQ